MVFHVRQLIRILKEWAIVVGGQWFSYKIEGVFGEFINKNSKICASIMQAITNLYHSRSFQILSYQQIGSDKTKKKRSIFFELWCKISCREQLTRGPGVCVSDVSCGLIYKVDGRLSLGWYQVTLLLQALVLLLLLAFTVVAVVVIVVVVVVVVVVFVPFSHVSEALSWEYENSFDKCFNTLNTFMQY